MFELSFIRKYLTPKKKQLSVSLIALLSIAVITVVVWLIVVFLSVTEGIEKTWLKKLTSLNAPIRLQPTQSYYDSYYYQVDRFSSASNYLPKTLGQKAKSQVSDPYDPEIDESLPVTVNQPDLDSQGILKDPVKGIIEILEELKKNVSDLAYQDVQLSGALLRLELFRQDQNSLSGNEMKSELTHVSYLSSFPDQNPTLDELILPPDTEDLNHLLYLAQKSNDPPQQIFENSQIHQLQTKSDYWKIPLSLLPEKIPFHAKAFAQRGEISHVMISESLDAEDSGIVERRGNRLFYKSKDTPEIALPEGTPAFSYGKLFLTVESVSEGPLFEISGSLQGHHLKGKILSDGLKIAKASFNRSLNKSGEASPLWPYYGNHEKLTLPQKGKASGILLAKQLRQNGVRVGDGGYLAYSSSSMSGTQEHHLPVYVAGFYDPGVMAVGNKCILVPPQITEVINASAGPFTIDQTEASAILVWLKNLKNAEPTKQMILEKLQEKGLGQYFTVKTFREYDFAKDLMQQFDSDKLLFSMIGIIILLVGCTNIISLLVLLVSDKKKEIGILRAMGASRKSIAMIFALSGGALGLFSCLQGVLLAYLTLQNIDIVVHFLSLIQGHEAFNPQFFGSSLPHQISSKALLFAAIATPILAIIAGLFPAIKAARLNPCESLRSE